MVIWEDSRRPPAHNDDRPYLFFADKPDTVDTFSVNLQVNFNSGITNFRPRIDIDPNGIMVVAWHSDLVANDTFGLLLCAYSDSLGAFGYAQSLFATYTGSSAANFGNAFYAPGLAVREIDGVTNFFVVWNDFSEDNIGNIYSVRGWVVESWADLDVDNDSLDVVNDTMNLRTQPAGPVYSPYAKGRFVLANTDDSYNPDPEDGPSRSRIDSISGSAVLYGPGGSIDSVFVLGLPSSMAVGQTQVCTVAVVIPIDMARGTYTGSVWIFGRDSLGALVQEHFTLTVQGPNPRHSLDSLRIAPIPFKPNSDPAHDAIHFQGITADATVRVYDLAGSLVFGPETDADGDGHIAWEAEVASGIYIYLVTTPDGAMKKGKLSVIR